MNRRFISIFGVTVLVFSMLTLGRVEGYSPRTGYLSETPKKSTRLPKVLFALEVSKHWDPAPAGAPPIFTLYDDRSVIYFDDQEKVHKHVVLSEAEFYRLSKILLNPNILTLKRHYITVWGVTCQDQYYFTFRISDLIHSIHVYGHPTMNGHFTMIRESDATTRGNTRDLLPGDSIQA